jgi:DNA-binding protein YbaB
MGEEVGVAERPNWSALGDMMADLRRATADLPDLHQRMLTVTGTAWSPDGMIKAVVGPRGHLLELDIDPRILRQPNSKALSAGILQTVRAAVEEAGRQSRELLERTLPSDMRARQLGGTDLTAFVGSHDADIRVEKGDDYG